MFAMLGSRKLKMECLKFAIGVLPVAQLGCSGSLRMTTDVTAATASTQAPKCAPGAADFQVETIDWESDARQRFESLAREHTVVVRVAACGWTILEACTAPAKYEFRTRPLQREIEDGQSNAGISFGATGAAPSVSRSVKSVRDIAIAGVFELRQDPSSVALEGSCDGATHVVSRFATGAFRISSNASRAGGVHIPYAGHAETTEQFAHLRQAGNPDSCAARTHASEPPPDCSAAIKLDVEPIRRSPASAIADHLARPAPVDPCVSGNAIACHQQCLAGVPSSCTALVLLCARGDVACTASAQPTFTAWSSWIAATR